MIPLRERYAGQAPVPTATGIPLRDLHLAWPVLWPLLESAVRRTPDKPDVLARLIAREAQLWAIYDDGTAIAAIVTQITLRPSEASEGSERGCRLWLIGGSRVREWASDFLCKLELWARSLGCVALWGSGREGWDRIVRTMGGSRIGTIAGFPAWERRL